MVTFTLCITQEDSGREIRKVLERPALPRVDEKIFLKGNCYGVNWIAHDIEQQPGSEEAIVVYVDWGVDFDSLAGAVSDDPSWVIKD